MANATAAQAYFAVRELEAQDKTDSSLVYTATFTEVVQKILQDIPSVTTQAEAIIGIRLAQGAPDAVAAQSGDYLPNRVVQFGQHIKPAQDVLFATDGDTYVTSLSEFPQWTVNYSNTGHVSIPEWSGSVGDTLQLSIIWDGGVRGYIVDHQTPRTYIYIPEGSDKLTWETHQFDVTHEGVPIASNTLSLVIGKEYHVEATLKTVGKISTIGSRFTSFETFSGKLTNILLTDNSDPSNSRWYPGVVNQATQPGDGELVLREVLFGVHNGTLTRFTTPVWKEV